MGRTANLLVANVEIESDQFYHRAYKFFEDLIGVATLGLSSFQSKARKLWWNSGSFSHPFHFES